MRAALIAVAAMALLALAITLAGGDFVDLAAGSTRVWFVGDPGVYAFDAHTGRTVVAPRPTSADYPLSIALAGGAAWIASVESGYSDGRLTRIDIGSGRRRIVWRGGVEYISTGRGGVYALLGDGRVALFRTDGRLSRIWSIPDAGRMTADGSGCWLSSDHWLLHIDRSGHLHRVVRAQLGDLTTGLGAVWLPQATSVLRIDERSGRVRTLRTGQLQLGGFQHDLAAGDGALWALTGRSRSRTTLARFDPRTGGNTGTATLPGIDDAVVAKPNSVWVATVIAPANQPASGYDVIPRPAHNPPHAARPHHLSPPTAASTRARSCHRVTAAGCSPPRPAWSQAGNGDGRPRRFGASGVRDQVLVLVREPVAPVWSAEGGEAVDDRRVQLVFAFRAGDDTQMQRHFDVGFVWPDKRPHQICSTWTNASSCGTEAGSATTPTGDPVLFPAQGLCGWARYWGYAVEARGWAAAVVGGAAACCFAGCGVVGGVLAGRVRL